MENALNKVIQNYKVTEHIASGGYGAVYKAQDMSVDRVVAVKMILPLHTNNPEFVERFKTEAQLVAKLEHPHIVPLYTYIHNNDGMFLVMRYLEGGNLRDILNTYGALSIAQALRILRQIISALSATHKQGIVHRDLKPENILLDASGNAYLSDFGIAKSLNIEVHRTDPNAIVGTWSYLAPEQINNDKLSNQTDIYALGIVIFESLSGKLPFSGGIMQILNGHLREPLPDISQIRADLPDTINHILQRATAKNPEDRYNDIEDLLDALEKATQYLSRQNTTKDLHQLPLDVSKFYQDDRNRQSLLKAVDSFWIKGILENSLHGTTFVKLGITPSSTHVEQPWDLVLRRANYKDVLISTDTHIIDVFDELNGKMLILGEPGSGKTMTLLELTRELIHRAKKDFRHPIPVVFNLASWGEDMKRFEDWLQDELMLRYQISKPVAKSWLTEEALLLLLDGLDEVAVTKQTACVEAINHFREKYGFVDIVICCRIADYQQVKLQLKLNGAIILQPLNDVQIEHYLSTLGSAATTLRSHFEQDPQLKELARSPLMLDFLALVYQAPRFSSLVNQANITDYRNNIFNLFVHHMYEQYSGEKPFSIKHFQNYLTWFAEKMRWHSEMIVSSTSIELRWLPSYALVHLSNILVFCLVLLISFSLGIGGGLLITPDVNGFRIGLLFVFFIFFSNFYIYVVNWNRPVHIIEKPHSLNSVLKRILFNNFLFISLPIGFSLSLIFDTQSNFGLIHFIRAILASLFFTFAYSWTSLWGINLLKYVVVRFIFFVRGETPFNLNSLLNFAYELSIMRRVGDSYTFIHRYILDYFADLERQQ